MSNPPKRPTVADIAARAGVSVATVDRVINARLPVKPATAARVREASEALGFHAAALIRQRSMERPLTLGFLLQRHSVPFYSALGTALQAATAPQGQAMVEYLDDLSPAHVAQRLRDMAVRCEGLGLVAADHPHVSRAIADLRAEGKPVVALLSDLSAAARLAYVGVDWRKMGRTAGWAMARLTKGEGEVAIIIGSHRYLATETCEIAFRTYLRERAPGLNLLEPMVNFEDPRLANVATQELLLRAPGLCGIYMVGGGVEGVMTALRDAGLDQSITVVAHDLTEDTRDGLIDGVLDLVLHQPREALASAAVRALSTALRTPRPPQDPAQIIVPIEVLTAENL